MQAWHILPAPPSSRKNTGLAGNTSSGSRLGTGTPLPLLHRVVSCVRLAVYSGATASDSHGLPFVPCGDTSRQTQTTSLTCPPDNVKQELLNKNYSGRTTQELLRSFWQHQACPVQYNRRWHQDRRMILFYQICRGVGTAILMMKRLQG